MDLSLGGTRQLGKNHAAIYTTWFWAREIDRAADLHYMFQCMTGTTYRHVYININIIDTQ